MRSIRPHLGLILYSLAGAAVGVGSVLLWLALLRPYQVPFWAIGLIAVPTALLVLAGMAEAQRRHGNRRTRHRTHARPRPINPRKAA
ncbi:hypothetical protein ACFZAR_36265 [Streptomyces sp. NPDC008222]|uniref:hypothetical protein n=1 Tax=Streptomyces sp. NPDC008222 TaxID=3364820 RepID=UPI0036EEE120